jgi:acyl carrier protein
MWSQSAGQIAWGIKGANLMTTFDAHRIQLNYPLQQGVCSSGDIRALIADQLGVNVERVTDQSHFMRDLGVDWLARLELVILVEEWTGLELHDDDVERITVVGDLIRYFASAEEEVGRSNLPKAGLLTAVQAD